jgi:hypothetical protein
MCMRVMAKYLFKETVHKANHSFWIVPEMRYCEISKEMSSLYFGLDVFGQLEVEVPDCD